MRVNQIIINRILSDNAFSLALAYDMRVTQQNVHALAKRNSRNGFLTREIAVNFFKKNGYTDKQIYI